MLSPLMLRMILWRALWRDIAADAAAPRFRAFDDAISPIIFSMQRFRRR